LRHARLAIARLRQAQGDVTGALAALDEAVGAAQTIGAEMLLRDAAAQRARQWAQLGRIDQAALWLADLASLAGSHAHRMEVERLAEVQILVARGQAVDALALAEEIRREAERHGRLGAVLEALVLQALAYDLNAQRGAALQALDLSLAMSAPESYVRLYLNQGPRMLALLREAAARGVQPGHISSLLAGASFTTPQWAASAGSAIAAAGPEEPALAEPLSERELEVLRLLAGYLSNSEIGRRLTVSTGTVKTHIHHIYGKLGVTGRADAIRRARALQLI
jgi:LuxR family maltose regulon positive regulatory protein